MRAKGGTSKTPLATARQSLAMLAAGSIGTPPLNSTQNVSVCCELVQIKKNPTKTRPKHHSKHVKKNEKDVPFLHTHTHTRTQRTDRNADWMNVFFLPRYLFSPCRRSLPRKLVRNTTKFCTTTTPPRSRRIFHGCLLF